jgi:hypothetical protein
LIDQASLTQMKPDPVVKPVALRILAAGLTRGRVPAGYFRFGHVGVEERAAVRGVLVDRAFAVHEPVTVAVGSTGRNQHRVRLVGPRAQVFLGPTQHILALRTQARKVGHIQAPRDTPAKNGARRAATHRPGEAELLSHTRGLVTKQMSVQFSGHVASLN